MEGRMMKFLRISTVGVAEVESFTVLGASSSRQDKESIGQFGSGAKHAILCALRSATGLIIYCGRTKIVPQTQPQTIHGVLQERLQFRIDNRTEISSMVLDFGSIDWTEPVPMMLRELLSNALDSVNGDWAKIAIDYCEKPRAKKDSTQVFVELTAEVREYMHNVHHYFLHVNGEENETCLAQNPMPCRFYRKGVFVHECEGTKSLYSYNCGDELPIDESRKLDTYRVKNLAAKVLSDNPKALKHVVSTLCRSGDSVYYEHDFSDWYLLSVRVAEAFKLEYGSDVCITDNASTYSRATTKGLNVRLIKQHGWFKAAKSGGIPDAVTLMTRADNDGLILTPAGYELKSNVFAIYEEMQALAMIGDDVMDGVKLCEFEKPISGGIAINGFYCPQTRTLAIHRDHVGDWKVIIEELSHVVTGANDETRDFQDYAFRLSALLMKKLIAERRDS
jgi:hypothetical protein